MARILIITKNLLTEQELQAVLQRSNEEVYCSYDLMFDAEFFPQVIKYFSLVIFSDTVSNMDISKHYAYFKQNGLAIIRKGRKEDLKNSEFVYLIDEIDDWVEPTATEMSIIEKIAKLTPKRSSNTFSNEKRSYVNEKNIKLFFVSLSSNEKKFLYHLYQYKKEEKELTRNELCTLIWETEATRSNLSQLSSLTNRIKRKLTVNNLPEKELTTSWKKGYFLGDLLFHELKNYLD